ncbi:Similar to Mitochondrial escape protein 2; acc. no. Q873L8 [Pyronema omphalodes CBS 100304]|uniref:Mitochondrial escape protein 2 n=1 Tax=Pyronema omphalodes (strain CBS 100304) TaxID=1076935 RepID=U4KXI2_PYROM|nr:Similar to Mitochondrial escape protein 2; acc. no. Q873L8 [Pyronema omphalodes CBS 100304]
MLDLLPIIHTRVQEYSRALRNKDHACHIATDNFIRTRCIPTHISAIKMEQVYPQGKDGGVFARFTFENAESPDEDILKVRKYLKENKVRRDDTFLRRLQIMLDFPFWKRHSIKGFKVLGTPWLDDMDRFPSRKLRVEFIGGNEPPSIVQQEDLYQLFRLYGKIADIIPHATPADDLPRHAMIRFRNVRGATTAKNCLDGYVHQETGIKLRILYGRGKNTRRILDWIVSNPKLAFPLIIAILGFFAVWVFDPVRGWSIRQRIKGGYDFSWRATRKRIKDGYDSSWRATREFLNRVPSCALNSEDSAEEMMNLNEEHPETIKELEKLKLWMKEAAVVVHGPRRGKMDLLRARVLDDGQYFLVIDCKVIAEAPNDGDMIEEAASQIGYRPLFSQFNYLSELALRAVMGSDNAAKKSSSQAKLDKILVMMMENMKRLALQKKGREHKGKSDEDFLHEVSDTRPVLILENFRHKEEDSAIYEKLAECATQLATDHHANVIFLTNDSNFFKSLPDRLFRTMLLDNSPRHSETVPQELARDVLGLYVRDDGVRKQRPWTSEQAWYFVDQLSKNRKLDYNIVLLHPLFRCHDGEKAIQHLQQAGMISIEPYENGRPANIKPGRPHHAEAFKMLTEDTTLKARMEMRIYKVRIALEAEKIEKLEQELAILAKLKKQPEGRVKYLLDEIEESQHKIDDWGKKADWQRRFLMNEEEKEEARRNWWRFGT